MNLMTMGYIWAGLLMGLFVVVAVLRYKSNNWL